MGLDAPVPAETFPRRPEAEQEGEEHLVNDQYRDLGQEAIHALRLEEAAVVVLRENPLAPADRAVLENAVRIARTLQKMLKMTG